MTVIISDDQAIEVISSEIQMRKPHNLKIVIKELNHLSLLYDLFKVVIQQNATLYRFELELSDYLSTESIENVKPVLDSIKLLSNLRVFKLKIFSYWKKERCEYRIEIVDFVLQFLKAQ